MHTLPANVILEKNKMASISPFVVLLEIELNTEPATTIRLARNTEDITFGGNLYSKFWFDLQPAKYSSTGEIPTITISVSNITRLMQPYIETLNGGVGSTITIHVVNTGMLDEDFSDLDVTCEILSCKCTVSYVEFVLGMPSLLRQRMPLHRYIALSCRYARFFKGVECKYSGAETECDGSYDRCVELSNADNFGGFVGLRMGALRLV